MYVEEKNRSWCSSSRNNDNRAITIEVASDKFYPYKVTDAAYKSLIKLLVDVCTRNDIKELKWHADKSLIGQVDKQNMTVHRWFDRTKTCPGDYLYNLHYKIAQEVNSKLNEKKDESISSLALDAHKFVVENGISDGLRPKDSVTREELWTMFNNYNKNNF